MYQYNSTRVWVGQNRIYAPCMNVYLVIPLPKISYIHRSSGLFSSIFWEQVFIEVRESSRTLKLFEQFDVQFRKWKILLIPVVILVQNMLGSSKYI
jgi:hypothetical protein